MPTWDDVLEIAAGLPEVEVSTWFRTPALRISKKGFARLRSEDGGLVVLCELDEKARLLDRGDPAFYTTPHYDGYPAILVDLRRIDREALEQAVTAAWMVKAPQRLRRGFPDLERTEKHAIVAPRAGAAVLAAPADGAKPKRARKPRAPKAPKPPKAPRAPKAASRRTRGKAEPSSEAATEADE